MYVAAAIRESSLAAASGSDSVRHAPSHGTEVPLVEGAALLDRSVAVTAGSGFGTGDLVVVSCDGWGPLNEDLVARGYTATHQRFRANFARVVAVTTDGDIERLTLDRPLLSPFALEHAARIAPYNGVREVVVRWLRMEGTSHHLDGATDDDWTEEDRARNANVTFVKERHRAADRGSPVDASTSTSTARTTTRTWSSRTASCAARPGS